jgi:hypothetical protein
MDQAIRDFSVRFIQRVVAVADQKLFDFLENLVGSGRNLGPSADGTPHSRSMSPGRSWSSSDASRCVSGSGWQIRPPSSWDAWRSWRTPPRRPSYAGSLWPKDKLTGAGDVLAEERYCVRPGARVCDGVALNGTVPKGGGHAIRAGRIRVRRGEGPMEMGLDGRRGEARASVRLFGPVSTTGQSLDRVCEPLRQNIPGRVDGRLDAEL